MRKYNYLTILKDVFLRKVKIYDLIVFHASIKNKEEVRKNINSNLKNFSNNLQKYSDYINDKYFLFLDREVTAHVLFYNTGLTSSSKKIKTLGNGNYEHIFYQDENIPGIPLFVQKDTMLFDVYKHIQNSKTIKSIRPKYNPPKLIIRKRVSLVRETEDAKHNNT